MRPLIVVYMDNMEVTHRALTHHHLTLYQMGHRDDAVTDTHSV